MSQLDLQLEENLELLHQLFLSATHDASAAMCRWTGGVISLSLDELCVLDLQDVCSTLKLGDELLAMVVLTLEGDVGGDMILTFDDVNGRRLAASLLSSEPQTEGEWSDLEKSALQETGNILGCAYMNALTRLIDAELVPSPPYFIQDYGASVIQQTLMAQAMDSDKVLICRTRFEREGEALNWHVLFVPSLGMREAMNAALGE